MTAYLVEQMKYCDHCNATEDLAFDECSGEYLCGVCAGCRVTRIIVKTIPMTRIIRKTAKLELTEAERMLIMLVDVIGRKNGNTFVSQNDITITSEGVGDIVDRLYKRGLIHKWRRLGCVQFTLTDVAEREARRWLGIPG